jgi:O-antigen/teichoic acid export membrane protein
MALSAPIFTLAQLGMRNVFVTSKTQWGYGPYFGLRLASNVFAIVVSVGLAYVIIDAPSLSLILAVLGIRAADSYADILMASYQARGRMVAVGHIMTANGVFTVLIVGVSLLFSVSPLIMAWLSFAVSMVVCLGYTAPVLRWERSMGWNKGAGATRSILVLAWPLGLAQSANSLTANFPVLFLTLFADADSVGRFAVLYYFITAANLIYNSVEQVAVSDFVSAHRSGGIEALRSAFWRTLGLMAGVGLVGALAFLVAGRQVISWLYGTEFAVELGELAPIAIAILLLAGVHSTSPVLLVLNRYRAQLTIAIASLVVGIVAIVVLAGTAGVMVAGYVYVAVAAARLSSSMLFLRS